jgi:hypothetical protein
MTTPDDAERGAPAGSADDANELDDLRPEHDSLTPALEDEPTPDEPPAR